MTLPLLHAAAAALAAGPLGCGECKLVASAVAGFADNATAIADVIASLEHRCNTTIPASHAPLRAACDAVVAGLVDLVPFAEKELSSLAWDGAQVCAVVGACEVDCCLSAAPEQVHLSLTSDPSTMAVMWTTRKDTATHTVEWGAAADQLLHKNEGGPSHTYTQFGWRGRLHAATITGLAPGQRVFYRVGDAAGGFSAVASFRTLEVDAGSDARALRIVSIADMGNGNLSDHTVAQITQLVEQGAVDLVLHTGDISYADGDMAHWDSFMRKVEPIASRVPYLVAPGNHEFWFNFTAYKARFHMPGVTENMYYALSVNRVRLLSLNTESELDVAQIKPWQAKWIEAELAAAEKADWRIVVGHRPLYCSNTGGNDIPAGNKVLRRAIEATLHTGGADLVIQGHVHDYERTWPVFNEKAMALNYSDAPAPVYVVNGAAGNREKNDDPPGGKPWEPAGQNYSRAVSFGLLHVTTSALSWTQITSADGSTQDQFTITKSDRARARGARRALPKQ